MAGWTDRWAEETGVSPAGPSQAPRCDQQRCLSSDGREPGVSGQGGRSQSAEREAVRGGGEARGSGASGQPVCPIRDELASTGSPANPVRLRGGPPAREIQLCVWLFCDKKTDKAHTLPGAPWAGQRAGATLPGECHQPGSDRDSWGQQGLSVLLAPGTSFGDVGMRGYLSPLQRTRTLLGAGCGHVILCGQTAGHGLASKAAGHCGLRLGERQCRVFTGSGSPRPRSGSRDLGRRPHPLSLSGRISQVPDLELL